MLLRNRRGVVDILSCRLSFVADPGGHRSADSNANRAWAGCGSLRGGLAAHKRVVGALVNRRSHIPSKGGRSYLPCADCSHREIQTQGYPAAHF